MLTYSVGHCFLYSRFSQFLDYEGYMSYAFYIQPAERTTAINQFKMKKFTHATVILFATSCLFSCSKTSSNTCTGTLEFTNQSSNPYEVIINASVVDTIPGKSSQAITEPSGSYAVEVLQLSGYFVYATDEHTNQTAQCGNITSVVFP